MQKVTFCKSEERMFFRTLRQRVDTYFHERNLSKNANAAMVLKTVILFSAYLGPFIVLLTVPMPFGIAVLLWLLMGWAMAGIGMSVMHDANHGAYSANRHINKLLGLTLNGIGGTTANWKVQHNLLHHTYTNITGADNDIDMKAILRLSPHTPHKQVHRGQLWYVFGIYSIGTIYWALLKDFVQHIEYRKQGLHKRSVGANNWLLARLIGVKLLYFFVFLILPVLCGLPFWQVITGFIVMHIFCGMTLAIVFQLAHTVEDTKFPLPDEQGNMEDSWAVHQLRTTMNFACRNKWLSWYVGGLNFQVEHHLFTRICHVHYPAIAPIVRKTALEFGHPYLEKPTLTSALRSHIRHLRTLGRAPLSDLMG